MCTVRVPLTQGDFALIDAEDTDRITAFRWRAACSKRNCYAVRSGRKGTGEPATVYMHREILGAPKGVEVDHRNGDGLDNTRSNIRIATHQQNMTNCRLRSNNTSGYIGVSFETGHQKWCASIRVNGRNIRLGCFDEKEDAAQARTAAAHQIRGEFVSRDEASA